MYISSVFAFMLFSSRYSYFAPFHLNPVYSSKLYSKPILINGFYLSNLSLLISLFSEIEQYLKFVPHSLVCNYIPLLIVFVSIMLISFSK